MRFRNILQWVRVVAAIVRIVIIAGIRLILAGERGKT